MKRLHIIPAPIRMALLTGSCLLAIAATASTASAAQFGVRIVNEAGEPVAGASVCVGLPGGYRQFGALFTDSDGQATVEVPNVPFIVTVSKTRFSGIRLNEPGRGFNLIKQITLAEGTPGPRCKAGTTLADAGNSLINVDRVDVEQVGQALRLQPSVTGEPTEYRLSASPDMEVAAWNELGQSILVPANMADAAEVYIQLRRFEGTETSWLEARSDVVTVFLPLDDGPAL